MCQRAINGWQDAQWQWVSYTHVVGGLAEVTKGRDGQGEGAVDVLGQLLGAAVRLGDVGGERGRHDCSFWMDLYGERINNDNKVRSRKGK